VAGTLKDFDYSAPVSVQEATTLLAKHGDQARMLAGGTDIIVQLREGLRDAEMVIDIKKIPELMAIDYSAESGLTLGAGVPCYQVYENEEISAAYPALADSTRIIGGWQIQVRASVGGNLCNSSPAADTIPALISLAASCRIAGPDGGRDVAVADFCTGPGQNVLEAGELLVSIQLPPSAAHSGSAYERFIPRNEMDIAVVGAGSWVQLDESGSTIQEARISLAAVGPTPLVAQQAADSLAGQEASEENLAAAGDLAREVASPIDDMRGTIEYRVHLVGVLVKRTLARAVARARGES
jgi:carbon-monoxide dehydrogenase medium subunit